MAATFGVVRAGEQSAEAIASHSRATLDRPLRRPAELWIAIARDRAQLLGAFQRGSGLPLAPALLRRGSGGPLVLVGEATVHVALALAHPAALWPCDPRRIVNRAVRPLLRALTRVAGSGLQASFFGRDWIGVGHRPAAWVGFAHDAASRRTLFEAFVAVRAPFAASERPSFRGRAHGTLESIGGRAFDPTRVADAIAEAYASAAVEAPDPLPPPAAEARAPGDDPRADPAWTASGEEAIGVLGAGPDANGRFRVGGDLLVSRDALAKLEALAAAASEASDEDLGRLVDATLGAPGVALDGVRSLESVRDVVARALRVGRRPP